MVGRHIDRYTPPTHPGIPQGLEIYHPIHTRVYLRVRRDIPPIHTRVYLRVRRDIHRYTPWVYLRVRRDLPLYTLGIP